MNSKEDYFEIVNAFFAATKLAATLLPAYFTARSSEKAHKEAESALDCG
jgi:hypothetical protein